MSKETKIPAPPSTPSPAPRLRSLLAVTPLVGSGSDIIPPTRLTADPKPLILFSHNIEDADLHYEAVEGSNKFIHCLGEACPLCKAQRKKSSYYLLPVYSVEDRRIEGLRISHVVGADTLLSNIQAALNKPDIADLLVFVSKESNTRYRIDTRPIPDAMDRDEAIISEFVEKHEQGSIFLADAYTRMEASDLAALPQIRNRLLLMGSYDAVS